MNRDEVFRLVRGAVDRVVLDDSQLLEFDVNERSIAFRMALYMAETQLIRRPLTIDCEYNRHIGDKKRVLLPPRQNLGGEVGLRLVLPDILIHERGSDFNNILVLEVKKPGELMQRDALKLAAFKADLEYMHAAHVIIGRDERLGIIQEILWVD